MRTELICLRKGSWKNSKGIDRPGPKRDEIVHAIDTVIFPQGSYYILEEYSSEYAYESKAFVPLVSDDVLIKELESIPQLV